MPTEPASWWLLDTPPGVCPECAVDHGPDQAHDRGSLHYQYRFYREHGRWPTWADAVGHLPPGRRAAWEEELRRRGLWSEPTAEELEAAKSHVPGTIGTVTTVRIGGDEAPVRTCRECGCTDERACPGGCWWVEADLCSRCVF